MKKLKFLSIYLVLVMLSFNSLAGSANHEKTKTKMEEAHAKCKQGHKTSSNCHEDVMKQCDLSKSECLKIMERMEVIPKS